MNIKLNKTIKLILILFFIISCNTAYSQYQYKALVQVPETDNFYKIALSPDIKSYLKPDFSDIRLYDSTMSEIPYILNTEKPIEYNEFYKEFDIIETEHKGNYTRLVIHNKNKLTIENIVLIIKNAEFTKYLELNASEDNKKWYVLKENYYFRSTPSTNNTSEIRVLNLPLNNYEYYEMLIYDFFEKPINILSAGQFEINSERGKYTETIKALIEEIPDFETKKSVYKISFPNAQYFDKVEFEINHETFYLRECEFLHDNNEKSKGKDEFVLTPFTNFTLFSGSVNTLFFSGQKEKEFYLRISNNDDKPIQIKDIKFFQLNTYITADLKLNNKYTVQFCDSKASAPVYDIKYFADKIPENIKELNTGSISKANISEVKKDPDNDITNQKTMIWFLLIAVIVLVGFFSYKMITDMKNRENP